MSTLKDLQFVFSTKAIEQITEKQNNGYVLKRYENPWFKNEVGVRREGLSFRMTDDEQFEYMKCKLDIQYFADTYCKIKLEDGQVDQMKLRDYQHDILDLYTKNRFSILMASRQVGKTVSAAITILWYCIFNSNKNVMVIANKGETTAEILNKIKDIYKLLPFFLKPGVSNWAHKSVNFADTKCRIMTANRTKEPAIGFSIDFLYLDEFAHIPSSIIEPYYRAAFPTVSAISNSKIVITSTPNGHNLFWKILTGSELPQGDVRKNNFKSLRVYWWQVPNRNVTYLRLNAMKLAEVNLTPNGVKNIIINQYQIPESDIKMKINHESATHPHEIHIQNTQFLKTDDIRRWVLVKPDDLEGAFGGLELGSEININQIAEVTSWKEETTKDIGSEEAFNQEYGLQFLASSNLLLDENTLARMSNQREEFAWQEIPTLNNRTNLEYNELQWIQNKPDLFDMSQIKNYYILLTVDLAEGLGQDYSVINIWRMVLKTKEELEGKTIESMYDLFRLEQIGIYRHNLISVEQLSEIFYLLCFEVFDDNKVKVVLEYNTFGATLLAKLPHLYQGRNRFSAHVFARYKHRIDDDQPKIGLKITSQKNLLIKDYQQRMNDDFIRVHEEHTIREIGTFVKKESNHGNLKFEAESGHDDVVMTVVSAAAFFGNTSFRNLVDEFVQRCDRETKDWIDQKILNQARPFGIDYSALLSARRRLGINGMGGSTTVAR